MGRLGCMLEILRNTDSLWKGMTLWIKANGRKGGLANPLDCIVQFIL